MVRGGLPARGVGVAWRLAAALALEPIRSGIVLICGVGPLSALGLATSEVAPLIRGRPRRSCLRL